jgi:hypothetical protein
MITTASQVSQVNGMANEGNRMLRAQIVMIGPMTTKNIRNAIARMTLVIVSPREGLGVIFMSILYYQMTGLSIPILLSAELLVVLIPSKVGLDLCRSHLILPYTITGACATNIEVRVTITMIPTVCRTAIKRATVALIVFISGF